MAIIPQMSSSPDQLPPRRVELILQQLEELPTLPAVAAGHRSRRRPGIFGPRYRRSHQQRFRPHHPDSSAHPPCRHGRSPRRGHPRVRRHPPRFRGDSQRRPGRLGLRNLLRRQVQFIPIFARGILEAFAGDRLLRRIARRSDGKNPGPRQRIPTLRSVRLRTSSRFGQSRPRCDPSQKLCPRR